MGASKREEATRKIFMPNFLKIEMNLKIELTQMMSKNKLGRCMNSAGRGGFSKRPETETPVSRIISKANPQDPSRRLSWNKPDPATDKDRSRGQWPQQDGSEYRAARGVRAP